MSEQPLVPLQADPRQKELDEFWLGYSKELVRKSSGTLDETARQIIAVTGILEGLYFHAIAYSGLRGLALPGWMWAVYLAPPGLFLLSLFMALLVFAPNRTPIDLRAARASALIHARVVNAKYNCLTAAGIFLTLGLVALMAALVVYLMG